LREEARVLVQKSAEFWRDGQVTQIIRDPWSRRSTFQAGGWREGCLVYSGSPDDLCLAMAAESILIERMPGKAPWHQVPNQRRETIWLRDVLSGESFAQSKSKLAIALQGHQRAHRDGGFSQHAARLIAGSTGSGSRSRSTR